MQWIRGGMVGESRRFSLGDKQQEATHLHFQRPAPSAFLPPGRARVVRVYPGALRPRRPRGRPAEPSQAPTPTSASRGPGWRAWPGRPDPGVSGFREGLTLKVGTKGDPRASGSAIQGRLGARPGRRGSGVQLGVRTWPPGRFPRPREGPIEVEARPALWPLVTGSHAGGRRKSTRG